MAIKNIIAGGIGFTTQNTIWIPTRGYGSGYVEVVVPPITNFTVDFDWDLGRPVDFTIDFDWQVSFTIDLDWQVDFTVDF